MSMPSDLARMLRAGVLPSLRRAWSDRLAQNGRAAAKTMPPPPGRTAKPGRNVAVPEAIPDIRDAQADKALKDARQAFIEGRTQQALTLAYEAARQTRRGIEAEKEAELENKRQAQIAGLESRSATAE